MAAGGSARLARALLLVGALSALAVGGCAKRGGRILGLAPAPLAPVAALPNPKLPSWIAHISPKGDTVDTLAQIRIIFKNDLIPVEAIESPDQQAKLKDFDIEPALPGHFRFLTPRMVGFQADRALPKATRVRVTLRTGLDDLAHNSLASDLAWTFTTARIQLTNLPGNPTDNGDQPSPGPVGLNPTLSVTANAELDAGTLADHASLVNPRTHASVGLDAKLQQQPSPPPGDNEDQPQQTFDQSTVSWIYTLTPRATLDKATHYKLVIAPGVLPARGNLPSDETFDGSIDTYAPLAFGGVGTTGVPDSNGPAGRFARGSPVLNFNNPLVSDSVSKAVTIVPAVSDPSQLIQFNDGDSAIGLNAQELDPDTAYTVTISAGLKDTFGQTLGKAETAKFNTGDVAPDFWAPGGLNTFPSGTNLQFDLSAVNLPDGAYRAAYRALQPAELVYTDSADPDSAGFNVVPSAGGWSSYPIAQAKNQTSYVHVPVRAQLGGPTGMLAYGVEARTYQYEDNGSMKWRTPIFYGLVQLTNIGIFAQWFPRSAVVRVSHLADGSPAGGAAVDVYLSKLNANSRPPASPCASGTADADGMLVLDAAQVKPCMVAGQYPGEAPALLAVARAGQDWAYVRTYDYSGYGYGIFPGWPGSTPDSRGTVFSDRQLYQPGEKAWLTVEAYYLNGDRVVQDSGARYALTLEAPDGSKSSLGTQSTNAYGTFSFQLALKKNQPLGYYTVHAKGRSGAEMTGQFQVAEFKPPNFKVTLTLDKQFAAIGDTVQAKSQSNYLFGSPVEGGKATYYVTRQQTQFAPQGWDQYSFGRQWYWPDEPPQVPSDVLQVSNTLGSDGSSAQAVQVGTDLPYAMTYQVDMQTTDVSNLSVSDSKTFTALPADKLIGVQSDWVANAGQPFSVKVIVTDPTGAPLDGQSVHVELDSMSYSAATQVVSGSEVAHNQIQYVKVAEADVTSAKDAQTVSLSAPKSGPYRIRANFSGSNDDTTASDTQIWVAGPQPVNWGTQNPDQLQIKLDKTQYKTGDTATALIQSPYPSGELYFAVIRADTLYHSVIKVSGGAPQVRFRVTADMLPNAAVEAVLVRTGAPLPKLQPGSLTSLARVGFAPFDIKLDDKYLKARIAPAHASLEPGTRQTVALSLTDVTGAPVRGQFTVMVVNEAVLQLSGYRPPDLVKTVYAERTIDTRFGDNRPSVVLAPIPSPVQKGWGYGGGFLAGAASTRIRKNFQPLAYFNGAILTDASGRASVTFTLPDDLTTWRVLVVATGASSGADSLRFANSDATFITTKPLVTNPLLPQFARPGDTFDGGVSVTNTAGETGTLSIDGSLEPTSVFTNVSVPGGGLIPATQFLTGGQLVNHAHLDTSAPGTATQAYRFTIKAGPPIAPSRVQFVTKLGSATDAFEVPFVVEPLPVTEYVVDTGVTDTHVSVPLSVDKNVSNAAGGLHVSIASTILPDLSGPQLGAMTAQESLPLLEPLASRLEITTSSKDLEDALRAKSEKHTDIRAIHTLLAQTAAPMIDDLQRLQMPDGGLASWPGGKTSDRWVTPYAAMSLAHAQAAGFAVDATMLASLKSFLEHELANPAEGDSCSSMWCKNYLRLQALIALSEMGETRDDFLSNIYDGRNDFDIVTRLQLARYLLKVPGWSAQADALAAQIEQTVYETGRFATINYPEQWGWLASPTAARAQTLRLFLVRHADPAMLDKLANSLLALRVKGSWQDSYDNAQALRALVDYLDAQPTPPNFSALVQLAGNTILQAQFVGYTKSLAFTDLSMSQLPRGQSSLVLSKTGQGRLHYVVSYGYALNGDQPGALAGVRITREIRPANQNGVVGSMGIAPPGQPLTLPPGQVWDIGLQVITDHPIDHVVITDPLPAGLEAVDTSFQTSTPYFQARGDSWEIDYQQIYRDKIVAYASRLEAGVYDIHYLVQSVTPGTFGWPGAQAQLEYAPEEFGRTASTTLIISSP